MDMNVAAKQALQPRQCGLGRNGRGVRRWITIFIGLRIDRHTAEGAGGQVVSFAWQAVTCGADTLFDTPSSALR
jgi:hypothetical protein